MPPSQKSVLPRTLQSLSSALSGYVSCYKPQKHMVPAVCVLLNPYPLTLAVWPVCMWCVCVCSPTCSSHQHKRFELRKSEDRQGRQILLVQSFQIPLHLKVIKLWIMNDYIFIGSPIKFQNLLLQQYNITYNITWWSAVNQRHSGTVWFDLHHTKLGWRPMLLKLRWKMFKSSFLKMQPNYNRYTDFDFFSRTVIDSIL